MPKLNTTINNLELKSSKLGSNTTILAEAWTDEQYPSAKLLYNNRREAHPIGSVLITSTSTNPSNTLGGTWELVDKAFKAVKLPLKGTSSWQGHNGSLTDNAYLVLSDHTVSCHLVLTSSMQLATSTVSLGQLVLSKCGITAFPYAKIIFSGDGTYSHLCDLSTNGTIRFLKTMSSNIPVSTTFSVDFTQQIETTNMLNDFCDKFYWKRTA